MRRSPALRDPSSAHSRDTGLGRVARSARPRSGSTARAVVRWICRASTRYCRTPSGRTARGSRRAACSIRSPVSIPPSRSRRPRSVPISICPRGASCATRAPKWLLLGREGIQPDDVIALGTNPRFINAFLTGLNTQSLGEMRWRNIPVRSRCTPLRRFWDRVTPPLHRATPSTDIVGIDKWSVSQPLGHPDHARPEPDAATGARVSHRAFPPLSAHARLPDTRDQGWARASPTG